MAVGIKPKGISTEDWLSKNAIEIAFPESYHDVPDDKILIMWVNNGYMTATEIIRGSSEFDYFNNVLPEETRPYKCYMADRNLTIDNAGDDLSFLKNKTNNLVTKIKKFFK